MSASSLYVRMLADTAKHLRLFMGGGKTLRASSADDVRGGLPFTAQPENNTSACSTHTVRRDTCHVRTFAFAAVNTRAAQAPVHTTHLR